MFLHQYKWPFIPLAKVLAHLVLDAPFVMGMLVGLDVGVNWPNVLLRIASLSDQWLRGAILDISLLLDD